MHRVSLGPIQRLIFASGESWSGLVAAGQTQQAVRYELCVLILVLRLGW